MPARKTLEQKRRVGRTPTTDSGGRKLPTPVVTLAAVAAIPEAPTSLGEVGRRAWDRLWTAGQAWLSVTLHLDVLTRLCEFHDEREAIRAQVVQDGYMVPGSKGQLRPHPLLARLAVVEDQMTRLESLCGFNPTSMSKLGYAEIKAASAMDKMMARRRGAAS